MTVEQESLGKLQHDIVEISAPPTSLQSELQIPKFQLPRNLKGLKILDIGAGGSDLVRTFSERGADSYGVDPRYSNLSDLERRIRFQNTHALYNSLDRSLRKRSLDRFIGNSRRDPNRYIAAYATHLPFKDDSFDIVVSMDTISIYLDIFYDLLLASVEEGLRVVKQGGTLQLCPFFEREVGFELPIDEQRLANESRVLEEVRSKGLAEAKIIPVMNDMNTLVLTKS